MAVGGLILAEEVEETPQDAVEVEPRNFSTFDGPATPWDDRVVAQPNAFAFGDQGIYNIGVRPIAEDGGRGGDDPFGWPLSLSALTLKNIGGQDFEPCDGPGDSCVMSNFDPSNIEGNEAGGIQGFEETGDGALYPGTTYTLQSVNPGFERSPILPQMPEYMVPWINGLPAGELHPQIDEIAGMVPNTLTPPNGGPAIEFGEVLFGADLHCASCDPAVFGLGPPNFGWGSPLQAVGPSVCPQHLSGVAGNLEFPVHGTWPVPNRVLRDGAFQGAGAPERGAHRPVLPHGQLPHPAPGGGLLSEQQRERLVESEKLACIGRLAAGVAHELNNPLQVMLGYLSLNRDLPDRRLAEQLAAVECEALRCKEVIDGLLELSRPPVAQSDVDLRALCEDVARGLRVSMQPGSLSLSVSGAAVARGDRSKLRQVVVNLVKNAVEAAGPAGHVDVRLGTLGDKVEVTVLDDGPGVSPQARARLFEPFFTTKPSGTGLGLAVSRAIALAHGGDIDVRSREPTGAVFSLRLPRAPGGRT